MTTECIEDFFICIFYELIGKCPTFRRIDPGPVNRAEDIKTFLNTKEIVIPTVSGCDMNHAGVIHLDKSGDDNPVIDLFLSWHQFCERG